MLDTNTALSALLWRGTPHRLVELAQFRELKLFTSPVLLAELEDVLGRRHLAGAVTSTGMDARQLMELYRSITIAVQPAAIPATARDPDDDHVLACAVSVQADLIVSGDSDLLVLKEFRGIPILPAAETLKRVLAS